VDRLFETEKLTLFEDILDRGLILSVRVTGSSMSPFLAGEEILKIQKVPASSLQIGDLIFYKTGEGFPMLHRIIKKQRGKEMFIFHTKGDAHPGMDQPVCERNVLGKVCGVETIVPGGAIKYRDMESFFWRSINYLMVFISLGRLIISRVF
jgi:signal peptidase I